MMATPLTPDVISYPVSIHTPLLHGSFPISISHYPIIFCNVTSISIGLSDLANTYLRLNCLGDWTLGIIQCMLFLSTTPTSHIHLPMFPVLQVSHSVLSSLTRKVTLLTSSI